jgi:ATPase subunit of ABC transporter with duplicated ATPase domains
MGRARKSRLRSSGLRAAADDLGRGQKLRAAAGQRAALASALAENLLTHRRSSGSIFKGESHEARVLLNSSGVTPTAASTAVSAASGVWLRRVLLAVAAFETLVGLIDLAVFVPQLELYPMLHF